MGLYFVRGEATLPILDSVAIPQERLERMAEDMGLSGRFIEDPFGFFPLHAIEKLLVCLQKEVEDPTFFYRALHLSPTEKRRRDSIVNVPLPMEKTGYEAVRGFTNNCNAAISGARFINRIDGQRLWILRTTRATAWSDLWPVQQYNLSIMLTGMRRLFGQRLCPIALRLEQIPAKQGMPDELLELPIEVSNGVFGLAFKLSDIASTDLRRLDLSKSAATEVMPNSNDFTIGAVAEFLSGIVGSETSERLSKQVANAFGISTRSYRRQLASLGTSHFSLLSDIRLNKAMQLLSNTEIDISSIAFELGYLFPGDFSRFFAKRTGMSPSAYRTNIFQSRSSI